MYPLGIPGALFTQAMNGGGRGEERVGRTSDLHALKPANREALVFHEREEDSEPHLAAAPLSSTHDLLIEISGGLPNDLDEFIDAVAVRVDTQDANADGRPTLDHRAR